jgi:hypothetical protein
MFITGNENAGATFIDRINREWSINREGDINRRENYFAVKRDLFVNGAIEFARLRARLA